MQMPATDNHAQSQVVKTDSKATLLDQYSSHKLLQLPI